MNKVWGFARVLAAVDYDLKKVKVFVRLWSALTVMSLLLVTVTLLDPGPMRWWSLGLQIVTLIADVMFLRVSLHRLARVKAQRERAEWAAGMYEIWSR